MNVRISNSNGTIEVAGDKAEVASIIDVFTLKILRVGLSAAEGECIRSGDSLQTVISEEQPAGKTEEVKPGAKRKA